MVVVSTYIQVASVRMFSCLVPFVFSPFPVCSLLQTPTCFPCVPFCVNPSVPFALPQGFPPTLPCFRCWSPARFILYCTVRFELRIVFAMRSPCINSFKRYGLPCSFSPVYDDLKIIHFWVVSTSVSKRVNVHNLSYWNSFLARSLYANQTHCFQMKRCARLGQV